MLANSGNPATGSTRQATATNSSERGFSRWSSSLVGSYLQLSSDAAATQGLGDSGFTIEIAANYKLSPHFTGTLSFGIARYKDRQSFSQDVVDLFGRVDTAESIATSIPLSAEVSYQSALATNGHISYRIGAGYTMLTLSNREIGNCATCSSSELELNGGGFLSGSLGRNLANGGGFGLTARQYASGDIDNALLLWVQLRR